MTSSGRKLLRGTTVIEVFKLSICVHFDFSTEFSNKRKKKSAFKKIGYRKCFYSVWILSQLLFVVFMSTFHVNLNLYLIHGCSGCPYGKKTLTVNGLWIGITIGKFGINRGSNKSILKSSNTVNIQEKKT
jgi:hypothetical protein